MRGAMMNLRVFRSQENKVAQRGLSLIELALALMILGLIVGTALEAYRTYSKPKGLQMTKAHFYDVEAALIQFLTRNGRLPCPAIMTDNPLDATSGVEMSTCATDATDGGPSTCTATGYCRSPGRDANSAGGADVVLSGSVPYITLGISLEDSIDGWGRKIKYVVSSKLTRTTTYNASHGAITILNANNSTALGGANSAQMVLLSAGEDGRGAYTIDGRLAAPCTGAGRDIQNCDEPANATYYNKSIRSYVPGADYYDDSVHTTFKIVASSDRWAYGSTLIDIINKGGRRVGIGVPTPENQVHVGGNIKASSSIGANNFCNAGGTIVSSDDGRPGTNCIPPGLFSDFGAGSSCPSGTMRGVASAQAKCLVAIAPGSIATGTCPTGYVMCGVNGSGGILCHVPGATTCP